MRQLILPDIHDKIDTARRIIDHEPHDRRVFLGDFFDDFPAGAKAASKTAKFVREQLRDPDADVLLGNHDLSYGWGWGNPELRCSGFTKSKFDAIQRELTWEDWQKFKLHLWVPGPRRPWLLTHAGFDDWFVHEGGPPPANVVELVDRMCDMTLRSMHGPIPYERGRGCSLLGADVDRWGTQSVGGLVWVDWRSLRLPRGIDQLVGHTPGREPRVEDCMEAIGVCLDTALHHYAILDDGYLEAKGVENISDHRLPKRGTMGVRRDHGLQTRKESAAPRQANPPLRQVPELDAPCSPDFVRLVVQGRRQLGLCARLQ